ncbi:preprotein translocase subunit SecE [Patescibacteria group bacterium]|nr:preprotein translocase subunit SecE [Patescibacteria group bacterium]
MKFLKQVSAEMKKVVWPNRNTTMIFTFIVIIVSLFVAYYLSLFDFIFTNFGLKQLI